MNIKHLLLISGLLAGVSSGATLQLSEFEGGKTILKDSSGAATNGMSWGIVVDTGGLGFADYATKLLNFTITNGFIGDTDDYFYLSSNSTLTANEQLGAAAQIIANYDVPTEVVGSQNYKILWFNTGNGSGDTVSSGDKFGLSSVTAALPAGNNETVSVSAFHVDNGSASFTVVPEPSTMFLTAIGAIALLRRKR